MGQISDRAKCQQLPLTLIGSADAQRFGNLGPEVWRWAERENYCILLSRWWHWSSRCVIQQGIASLKGPAARLGRDGPLRRGGTRLLGTSMGVGHEYPSATRDVPQPCQLGAAVVQDRCLCFGRWKAVYVGEGSRSGVTWVAWTLWGHQREHPCCSDHGAEPWEHMSSWLGVPKAVNFLHFLIFLPFGKSRVLPEVKRGGLERDQWDLPGITMF